MMRVRAFPARSLVPLILAAVVQASESVTVTLHDGSQIKGSFAGGGSDDIRVLIAGQTLTLKTAAIEDVKFESRTCSSRQAGLCACVASGDSCDTGSSGSYDSSQYRRFGSAYRSD